MNPLLAIVSLLVPPYSVYRMCGIGGTFWLNLGLTLLGYVAGSAHAAYVFVRASPAVRARTYRASSR